MLNAKELSEFILKNYEPNELIIWQTFSKDDVDSDMSDEKWAQVVERMDDIEISQDDFGIPEVLSQLEDEEYEEEEEEEDDDE